MTELTGRVAIVTGGGGGIGGATCRVLARAGAAVVVADIALDVAEAVADAIEADGGSARAVECDVADEQSVAALVGTTVKEFDRLDVVHNNAALTAADTLALDTIVTEMDLDIWNRMFAVNLTSQMLVCKHAIPAMLAGGGGSIINMSSGAANIGDTTRVAYGASKAGVAALTRYVAASYGKQGVRVNGIVPGLVLTPAVEAQIPAEMLEHLEGVALTPYVGAPDDVAQLVLFLASHASRYVTGQMIAIDGGMSIRGSHS